MLLYFLLVFLFFAFCCLLFFVFCFVFVLFFVFCFFTCLFFGFVFYFFWWGVRVLIFLLFLLILGSHFFVFCCFFLFCFILFCFFLFVFCFILFCYALFCFPWVSLFLFSEEKAERMFCFFPSLNSIGSRVFIDWYICISEVCDTRFIFKLSKIGLNLEFIKPNHGMATDIGEGNTELKLVVDLKRDRLTWLLLPKTRYISSATPNQSNQVTGSAREWIFLLGNRYVFTDKMAFAFSCFYLDNSYRLVKWRHSAWLSLFPLQVYQTIVSLIKWAYSVLG